MRLAALLLMPCLATAVATANATSGTTVASAAALDSTGKVICFDETVGPITPPEICIPDPRPAAV